MLVNAVEFLMMPVSVVTKRFAYCLHLLIQNHNDTKIFCFVFS